MTVAVLLVMGGSLHHLAYDISILPALHLKQINQGRSYAHCATPVVRSRLSSGMAVTVMVLRYCWMDAWTIAAVRFVKGCSLHHLAYDVPKICPKI